jgi:hypothetical protein
VVFAGGLMRGKCGYKFDLADGGRVSIPPDQVMRMWNEEQRRNWIISRNRGA